jgi:hypothetical protein
MVFFLISVLLGNILLLALVGGSGAFLIIALSEKLENTR